MGSRATAAFATKRQPPIPLSESERHLSQRIVAAHASSQGALAKLDKDYVRALHISAKQLVAAPCRGKVLKLLDKRLSWIKDGSEIVVDRIKPRLVPVGDTFTEDLWMLGRACWSMPFSKGYGRRLRFLVIDEAHDGLIGLIGLQSPPADLACRDRLFDYPKGEKLQLVNQTMDAYTIGALPPYSFLLAGKLCAGLVCANAVREAYWRQYGSTRTQMESRRIKQPLVAVTTTSAFGRSSIYNRLRFGDRLLASQIGNTKGYGLLHLEHLYREIETLLARRGMFTPGGFGNGPKVRWQNVTRALQVLDLPTSLLAHGLERAVYLFPFMDDLSAGMSGGMFGNPLPMDEAEYAAYWLERWALPRAQRFPSWALGDCKAMLRHKITAELPIRRIKA